MGGQGLDVHDHDPHEGLLQLLGGAIRVVVALQPPLLLVHAHDQPLELVPIHTLAVGVAEHVAGPGLVEVAQDDAAVLLDQNVQLVRDLVAEA